MNPFEREGEWGGYRVTEMPKGWLIEVWSKVGRNRIERKTLLPFNKEFPKGQDLHMPYNETLSFGDAITKLDEVLKGLNQSLERS